MTSRVVLVLALVALVSACDGDAPPVDAGTDAPPRGDAGPPDGAIACVGPRDAGPQVLRDAGPAMPPPVLDCGDPELPAGTTLRRAPYLESATPTSVRVSWTSTGGGAAVVRWAPAADGPWTEVAASQEMFARARTTDTEDYVAYDAVASGLEEGRAYCYGIVEAGVVLARGMRFDTAWTGTDRPMRILAFGDSGQLTDGQLALRDRMMEREHDIFLHLGDIAYGEGTFPQFEERFFGVYSELLHRVPTFPTMGNHEFATDRGQPYLDVFHLSENAWREEERERYYSFDWGNVHFVTLDTNEAFLLPISLDTMERETDDMIDWLEDDLASSDAEWKIAFFHHPPFTSSTRGPSQLVRNLVVPVLEANGVDLVMVGHDHHYERTVPITELCNDTGEPGAITYVVAGGGGASLRDVRRSDNWFTADYEDQIHTYVSLEIHGCTAHGSVFGADGAQVDDWYLDGCD